MSEYAEIVVTEHPLPFGRRYRTYEWKGKPTQPVLIDYFFVEEALSNIPWPLAKVEDRPEYRGGLYVRKDGWLWPLAHWVRLKLAVRRYFELIYCRLILTAMVWGLAYVPEAEVPSWKHLGRKRK